MARQHKDQSPLLDNAAGLPGIIGTAGRLFGVQGGAMPLMAPLATGVGCYNMYQGAEDALDNGLGWGNAVQMLQGGAGVWSGVAGMHGTAATALGASATATAGTSGLSAAWGASAAGTVGAVAGAGLAGMAVGSIMNSYANSEDARKEKYGQDMWGRDRTRVDRAIDRGIAVDEWFDDRGWDKLGGVAGGATAVVGSWGATPIGMVESWFD